jgi:serine protease Do
MKSAAIALAAMVGVSFGNAQPSPTVNEADAVRGVLPSVVSIDIVKPESGPDRQHGAGRDEHFYGSGFVIDRSGLVLTNRHVVAGAKAIAVTFANGSQSDATLCASSGQLDLALIKVQGQTNLSAVRWGNSDRLLVGERVLAIGNPFGIGTSVSTGIVSALHRHISGNTSDDFIQTDAAINHGNSGGVLIDQQGEVVGINTKFLSDRQNGGSLGVGFAIPSQQAIAVAGQLKHCQGSETVVASLSRSG